MLPLNVYVAWRERAALDRSGAGWITLGRLVGTFGGLWILAAMPASALNLLIGAATILAATATLVLPSFRAGRQSFIAAGLVTGVTETATGIGGPPARARLPASRGGRVVVHHRVLLPRRRTDLACNTRRRGAHERNAI